MDIRNVKKIAACLISLFMLVGAMTVSNSVFKDISEHGVIQSMSIYDQPEDTIDVLFVGSSHVHCGVNTAKLWEDYGIAAYDYSSAEQPLWITYHYIIEACKTQKPKVIVLDFYSPAAFQDDYKNKYLYLSDSLYGFKFSFNKLMMMHDSFDGNLDLWNKYFPGYFGYHDQYTDVELEDFGKLFENYEDFKGFVPRFSVDHYVTVPGSLSNGVLPPSEKSQKFLKKIIDYTKKKGIELYITAVPYALNTEMMEGIAQHEDERYNWLEQYVEGLRENGDDHVYFDYSFKHMESFGLLMTGEEAEDMYDAGHVNYYGSCKVTDFYGNDLIEHYGRDIIPDRREDPDYESWDRNVEVLKQDVDEQGWEWR